MTTTTHPRSRRWTPAAIRQATPFPKPECAIDRLTALPTTYREEVAVSRISRMLADADLLDVRSFDEYGSEIRWLLMPVDHGDLDLLATFRAEAVELENGHDDEAEDELFEDGDEHDAEDEINGPSLWAPDRTPHTFVPSESTDTGMGE